MGLLSKIIFGADIKFDTESNTIMVNDIEFVCKNNETDVSIAELNKQLDELELSLNGIKEQIDALQQKQAEAQKINDLHTEYINNNANTLKKIAVIVTNLDEKHSELVDKLNTQTNSLLLD